MSTYNPAQRRDGGIDLAGGIVAITASLDHLLQAPNRLSIRRNLRI